MRLAPLADVDTNLSLEKAAGNGHHASADSHKDAPGAPMLRLIQAREPASDRARPRQRIGAGRLWNTWRYEKREEG